MPQVIHQGLLQALAQLFNGNSASSRPTNIYLGLRNDTPAAADTMSTISGHEIGQTTANGYARQTVANTAGASPTIPDSAIGSTGWQLVLPQQSIAFSGPPSPNSATHWFLTSNSAVGSFTGTLYASGPLNPAALTGTVQTASGGSNVSGSSLLTVTNTFAASLNVNDWLLVGTIITEAVAGASPANGTQERVQVASIGAANSGGGSNTQVTLVGTLANNHAGGASGDPVYRDGVVRVYGSGITEQVTPSLLFTQFAYPVGTIAS